MTLKRGKRRIFPAFGRLCAALAMVGACGAPAGGADRPPARQPATRPAGAATTGPPVYRQKRPHPDGIGKVYMGREIAKVMGHLGAGWLDRPEREREERPRKAIEMMELKPTDVVADIGAGSGYFTFRIAEKVPRGKVLAVDIQPEMLKLITRRAKQQKIANVEAVLGKEDDPALPENGVDVVLMVDAYHEFEHPREMMLAVMKALKPGGRVIDIEYRGEDPNVPIKELHKMTEAQAVKEMESVGLRHVKTLKDLPQQHFMVFEKPAK